MNLSLTGTPDFLLDTLSDMAKQRGHSVTRFALEALGHSTPSVEPRADASSPLKWDVLIVAAVGQPIPDPAKLRSLPTETEYVVLITQDEKSEGAPLPFAHLLTVIVDAPTGPGDPSGKLTYWTRQMTSGDVLAFGKPARKLEPFIDVRDASAWILESVEARRTGKFRLRGEQSTLGELLETVRPVVGKDDVNVTYADDNFLRLRGVDPERDIPLWSPADAPLSPAGGDTVEAEARLRPLRQTIQDTLNWEPARVTKADDPWLSAEREHKLLTEWPKYDPTGKKRRHHLWKLISFWVAAILVTGALFSFLSERDHLLDKTIASVRSADNGALSVLSAFQPSLLPELYAKHGYHLFLRMDGDHLAGPAQIIVAGLAAIGATPQAFWDLYVDGGIINLLGGLLTMVFGIVAWPVLMRLLFEIGRLFPHVFPQMEGNVRRNAFATAGRTLIAFGVPVVVLPLVLAFVDLPGSPLPGSIVLKYILGTLACVIPGYAFVSVGWRKIEDHGDIFDPTAATSIVMPVVVLALTLMVGTGISAGLQILLVKTINDVNWLVGQLLTSTFLSVLVFLDGVHIAKSIREVIAESLHLRR